MKPCSFSLYTSNWLASAQIAAMTPAEEGAYIRLLCYAWNSSDCGLPDDDNILAAMSRLGEKEWRNGSGEKLRACFYKKDGRLYNERLMNCREKTEAYSRSRSLAAQALWKDRAKTFRSPEDIAEEKLINEGKQIAIEFIDAMIRASGRKLVTSIQSTTPYILKLLRHDQTPELIRLTIAWLEKENPKLEMPFVVLSGSALVEKWDRIQAAMSRNNKSKNDPKRIEWLKVRDSVTETIWRAKASGADKEELARVMSVCRDKWGKVELAGSKDAVSAGIDLALNNPQPAQHNKLREWATEAGKCR